jgi:O-antigen/teichoic acid export membrane protein
MTGLDLQRHFYVIHGAGAATNVVLVTSFAPAFGIRGAVWAAYGTEAVLILIQVSILIHRSGTAPRLALTKSVRSG